MKISLLYRTWIIMEIEINSEYNNVYESAYAAQKPEAISIYFM